MKKYNTPGRGCSKQGQDNPGLVQSFNSDMKAEKANSVLFDDLML